MSSLDEDTSSAQLTPRQRVDSFRQATEADDVERRGHQIDSHFAYAAIRRMLTAGGEYSLSLDELSCLDADDCPLAMVDSESAACDGVLGVAFDDSLRVIDLVDCSPASDCGQIEQGDELSAFAGMSISDLLSQVAGCKQLDSSLEQHAASAAGEADSRRPSTSALLQRALRGRAGTYVHLVLSRCSQPNETRTIISLHLRRQSRQTVLRRMERRNLLHRLETLFIDLQSRTHAGESSAGGHLVVQRLQESNAALLLQLQSALALTREMQSERAAAMTNDRVRSGEQISSSPCSTTRAVTHTSAVVIGKESAREVALAAPHECTMLCLFVSTCLCVHTCMRVCVRLRLCVREHTHK
jgi:hypothetical protein